MVPQQQRQAYRKQEARHKKKKTKEKKSGNAGDCSSALILFSFHNSSIISPFAELADFAAFAVDSLCVLFFFSSDPPPSAS